MIPTQETHFNVRICGTSFAVREGQLQTATGITVPHQRADIAQLVTTDMDRFVTFQKGDQVTHAEHGDGEVIDVMESRKLRAHIFTVRYTSGEVHSSLAGDLKPRAQDARTDGPESH